MTEEDAVYYVLCISVYSYSQNLYGGLKPGKKIVLLSPILRTDRGPRKILFYANTLQQCLAEIKPH